MCQTACPVSINTGDLVKRLRTETHGPVARHGWTSAAKHWSGLTRAASAGLTVAAAVPSALPAGATALARKVGSDEDIPQWTPDLPAGGRRRARKRARRAPVAVYLPSCVNAMFGPAEGGAGVQAALESLCRAAGVELLVPAGVDALCCGTPWTSKGLADGALVMRERTATTLSRALTTTRAADGVLPVITDASSCTEGLRSLPGLPDGARVIDAVEFVATTLLPLLPAIPDDAKLASIVVHDTCSSTRGGFAASLHTAASAVAHDVRTPVSWGCCAFAGDRGLLHPELSASATAVQAAEIAELDGAAHVSCNRPCEIGMTRATGTPYRHVIEALADLIAR
jgi:D-lactate dehydrogenase